MSHRLLRTFVRLHPIRLLIPLALLVLLIPATTGPQGLLPVPSPAPGGTATLLSDGRWLLLGGEGRRGPLAGASIWSPSTQALAPLAASLDTARAWHTATVLPDGTVLVLGGLGATGRVVTTAERFDPATERFAPLALLGVTPRAQHTATVLTDGRLLITGGVGQGGRTTASAELWHPATGVTEAVHASLDTARRGHAATLLPDGAVGISGGIDPQDTAVAGGEVFDPGSARFTGAASPSLPDAQDLPQLAGSLPNAGATDVPLEGVIALRFSKPLRVETVTSTTVLLSGPHGLEPAGVVAAEGGRLAFITPEAPLAPNSSYTLSINGAIDATGFLVPPSAVRFTTARAAGGGSGGPQSGTSGSTSPDAPAEHPHRHGPNPPGAPAELDAWDYEGARRDGKPSSPWQALSPLQAPPGVTALAGQVLKLNGHPLADVTLRIGARSARTDHTGRFLLTDIPAGYPALTMDGNTASRRGRTYGTFTYGVHVDAGKTNVLPWTIWLPLIDTQHAVTLPVPTPQELVVTTPRVPGLEMRIPAGVVLRTHEGPPLTSVSLTQLPLDRTPFPLPEGTTFFFTPQTHGARVLRADGSASAQGVRFILPNTERLAPGVRVDLSEYSPRRGWYVYGQGTVRRDGRQIQPDPGVQFLYVGCLFILAPPSYAPPSWAKPGGTRCCDPVDPATGLFVLEKTDLVVPDVIPIVLTRAYRPAGLSRQFGDGGNHPYFMYLVGEGTTYSWAELIRADGSRIRYERISPGTGYTDAVMEHTSTPTAFLNSRLTWNVARAGWDIILRDGTRYEFMGQTFAPGPSLTAIQDRWGNRLTVEYSAPRVIKRITTPNRRWVEFTYGPGEVITQARDHAGRVVTYEYGTGNRVTAVVDSAGGRTEYTYGGSGRMVTLKDARGIVFLTNEYDSAGRVTRQTQADGTTYQLAYTLDQDGKIIQTDITNPRGVVRRLTFNASGYVLTDTAAFGTALAQTITYVRDSANRPTSITDALGRRTDYSYDTMGNVLTVSRLAGTGNAVTTSFTYEPAFNQVATVTDPLNHTTTFSYDAVGNVTTVTNPLGQPTTFTYNASGQPLTVTTPAGTTTFTYDGSDLVTVTDPTGRVSTQFADTLGRRIAVTSPQGQRTRYEYDALNRLVKITDPLGGLTQFTYDPNGNLLNLTDARNNTTTYVYSTMDRVQSRTDPLLRAETYVYDNNGSLTSFTDRKSQVTNRVYDALDRLTQVTYADQSTTTYAWDTGNRLTQIVDSLSGTITRTYDLLDRLTQETTPQGSVSYTYDPASRRTSMTVAGQPTVTYGYDDANRLTSITQSSTVVGYAFDTTGRRTALTLPSGISTEYAYDAASRLVGLTYKYGPTTLGTLTYAYDANGSRRQTAGTWARTGTPQAVASATYDAANRQLTFGGQTLTYDFNGNLTSDGTMTYTWDARNRLVGLGAPGLTASFQYDAVGRRVAKTFNGTTTSALYNALDATQETTGATVRNILTGLGIDEYLSHASTSGESRSALADALGSTIALVDASGGVVTEYTYEPFGATAVAGSSSENSAQYTGRENDGTGLYYYRARYYYPSLKRFISEDPIGFAGGDTNLYRYVRNSPVQLVDRLGLYTVEYTYPDSACVSLGGRKDECGPNANPSDPPVMLADATDWNNSTGGRSHWDGPTNGNWGGKCWSGGQYSCGPAGTGDAPPLDSGDELYRQHDLCTKGTAACDRDLVNGLNALPADPRQWPRPPRPGTERDSQLYKRGAEIWFRR